ncbi:ribosomal protein S5-alanine N-acetyltransferase [Aliivibrio kagoshimensis]|uniref:ribosomal protein S5-alanine N-acetyltransferase n=1 Tax=Aliivibrio kagoshimensis TaxID=2910230 RepID=UPI003D145F4E
MSDVKHSLNIDELVIRAATPEDDKRLSQYFIDNRQHLKPWEPKRDEAFFTAQGWAKRLIQLNELHKHNLAYYFVIQWRGSDEVIGTISYSNIVKFPFYACHVGYSLAESAQGKGVMRRALQQTNQWLFDHQDIHRVMAAYIPTNNRSGNVLSSLGFEKEGYAKNYLFIDDKWQDHVLTSLTNEQWVNPN